MAKGYPDFFGHSIFPQYGSFQAETYAGGAMAINTDNVIFTLSGKGVILGGWFVMGGGDLYVAKIKFTVDGQLILIPILASANSYGFGYGDGYPIALTCYDEVNDIYSFNIRGGISFASSYIMTVDPLAIAAVTPEAQLIWSKVV